MAGLSAVILAGGAGTRLRSAVPDLPKALAPVGGRPFIEYLLERLVAAGVRRIVLAVGYRADAIVQRLGPRFGDAALSYSTEAEPLGTGGAVRKALAAAAGPALVLNGDTLLDLDYAALAAWYAHEPEALAMVVRPVDDTSRYGAVVVEDGRVRRFAEKGARGPGLINAGVYVLRSEVFERFGLEGRFSLEEDLLAAHAAELRPRAWTAQGYFIDIGLPADYERAQRELPALRAS
jgi:D-glycero-alpha-D-manno-heptose 1-phosphate guanylyltransferase